MNIQYESRIIVTSLLALSAASGDGAGMLSGGLNRVSTLRKNVAQAAAAIVSELSIILKFISSARVSRGDFLILIHSPAQNIDSATLVVACGVGAVLVEGAVPEPRANLIAGLPDLHHDALRHAEKSVFACISLAPSAETHSKSTLTRARSSWMIFISISATGERGGFESAIGAMIVHD